MTLENAKLENRIDGVYANVVNIEKIETEETENKLIKTVYFKGGGIGKLEINKIEQSCSFENQKLSMSIKSNHDDDSVFVLWKRTVEVDKTDIKFS